MTLHDLISRLSPGDRTLFFWLIVPFLLVVVWALIGMEVELY